jgi:glutathione S-transferase
MRARLAIYKSKQTVELRDVKLNNKPAEMLAASPKATVPILVLSSSKITSSIISSSKERSPDQASSQVIDESLDIMLWALSQSDPDNLLRAASLSTSVNKNGIAPATKSTEILSLVNQFDHQFKPCLEAYKCAKRYHETNLRDCRQACEVYIQDLEQRLNSHEYLIDEKESMADIALLPFIRQFARVERQWYLQSPYPQLKRWLNQYLQSVMFTKVMAKYPLWMLDQPVVKFAGI